MSADCQGCSAVLDCVEDSLFGHFTLSSDPTFPWIFTCPPGFNCRQGGLVSLDCCGHLITRTITLNMTNAELAALFADMLAQCRQFQAECSDPPTDPPGGGNPIDPPQPIFWNFPQTCTVRCPDGSGGVTVTEPAGRVWGTSQAGVDRTALGIACADSLRRRICLPAGLDMPLTSAVWAPSLQRIFGARAGLLFEFDANGVATGRQLTFAEDYIGDSYLVWDAAHSLIYATAWHDNNAADRFGTGKGIYKINPTTLAVSQFWSFGAPQSNSTYPYDPAAYPISPDFTGTANRTDGEGFGPRAIFLAPGGKLFLACQGYHDFPSIYRFNPATGKVEDDTIPNADVTYDFGALMVRHLIYDAAQDRLWWSHELGLSFLANALAGDMHSFGVNMNILQYFTWTSPPGPSTPESSGAIYGLELCPANSKLYGVTRSALVVTLSKTATPASNQYDPGVLPDPSYSNFTLARASAKPRNIRWSNVTNRLYIPTMQDNAVIELDAANVVTNTFLLPINSIPWDIVSTDTKVFAVCLGTQGLRRII